MLWTVEKLICKFNYDFGNAHDNCDACLLRFECLTKRPSYRRRNWHKVHPIGTVIKHNSSVGKIIAVHYSKLSTGRYGNNGKWEFTETESISNSSTDGSIEVEVQYEIQTARKTFKLANVESLDEAIQAAEHKLARTKRLADWYTNNMPKMQARLDKVKALRGKNVSNTF